MKNLDDNFSSDFNDSGLISLAFACNEMVNQLSNGLKLESQGDRKSALAELDVVRDQIDSWLDRIDELEAEELDKNQIVGNLKEARQAVDLDLQD
ncbi:MAG: hypothetical protein ABEJ25_02540 [Candidatus Bipolaricaulia bacterium]